jgi:hypothetical protein
MGIAKQALYMTNARIIKDIEIIFRKIK